MKQIKFKYDGLLTLRLAVVTQPLMSTSSAKIKVKTENATEPWEERDVSTPLQTSITTTID